MVNWKRYKLHKQGRMDPAWQHAAVIRLGSLAYLLIVGFLVSFYAGDNRGSLEWRELSWDLPTSFFAVALVACAATAFVLARYYEDDQLRFGARLLASILPLAICAMIGLGLIEFRVGGESQARPALEQQ